MEHALQKNSQKEYISMVLEESRKKMKDKIDQYQIFKEILDRNSQMLGISYESLKYLDINPAFHNELQTTRFKIVDCKLIFTLVEEMRRQRKV